MKHRVVEPNRDRQHSFIFNRDEVIEALMRFASSQISPCLLPNGHTRISGLERSFFSENALTLYIDEKI